MPESSNRLKAKEAAGKYAADLIQDGMIIGLGTGSTAAYFIHYLIERYRAGLRIEAIATSKRSFQMALEGGIPLLDPNHLMRIDWAIDGADEIDQKKQMIKGGGGALLWEKIVAYMADEMIVVVDESKCVDHLGAFPLPVELIPFGYQATLHKIHEKVSQPTLRLKPDQTPFLTDGGNLIADLHLKQLIEDPDQLNHTLRSIPGVVETGLFTHIAGRVIIGHLDGSVTVKR